MLKIDTSPNINQYLATSLAASCGGSRDEQSGLPADFYTDARILDIERQQLFEQEWICIARADEVPNRGDYLTTKVLAEPVILVRDKDGDLQVFSNVCRHRCMQVASGVGQAIQGFSCPYHAWHYNLKGELISAPLMPKTGFNRKLYSLPKIRFEVWQGFVFVTLNADVAPISSRLGALDKILANYHTDEMLFEFAQEEIWHCNWKVLIENFIEGYHLSCVHPQTLKPVTPTQGAKKLPTDFGFTAYAANYDQMYPAAQTFSHPDLTVEEAKRSNLFCVFPSLLVSQSPHLLVFLMVQPLDATSLRLRWGMSIRDAAMDGTMVEDLTELWQQVNEEDRIKLEQQQQAYGSRFAQAGTLAPEDYEGTIKDFHRYLRQLLAPEQVQAG